MTIHIIVPVFNRLAMTRNVLANLRHQEADDALRIVVVNDGSTDGTAEFLASLDDIVVLTGNGNLWWGGAIDLGLRRTLETAVDQDWVVFVNNDTEIQSDFIQRLLDAARKYAPAAVGSVVRNIEPPHQLISVGPRIDANRFRVTDVGSGGQSDRVSKVVEVDALSGRGVIYPVVALKAAGGMRPRWLPHYLSDYELSLRVREKGWRLFVAADAVVYSTKEFGSSYRPKSLHEKFFTVRSPTYLPAQVSFWWQASGLLGRVTLPIRLFYHFIKRQG